MVLVLVRSLLKIFPLPPSRRCCLPPAPKWMVDRMLMSMTLLCFVHHLLFWSRFLFGWGFCFFVFPPSKPGWVKHWDTRPTTLPLIGVFSVNGSTPTPRPLFAIGFPRLFPLHIFNMEKERYDILDFPLPATFPTSFIFHPVPPLTNCLFFLFLADTQFPDGGKSDDSFFQCKSRFSQAETMRRCCPCFFSRMPFYPFSCPDGLAPLAFPRFSLSLQPVGKTEIPATPFLPTSPFPGHRPRSLLPFFPVPLPIHGIFSLLASRVEELLNPRPPD